jgi:hypothetical protein
LINVLSLVHFNYLGANAVFVLEDSSQMFEQDLVPSDHVTVLSGVEISPISLNLTGHGLACR